MAHSELWQQLAKLNGPETAKKANCQYLDNPQRYIITLLNTEYQVNVADKEIFPVHPTPRLKPAGFLEQLCILAYLINAQDLPSANKLVKAETFPGGQFFFRGNHSLPTKKLEKAFGQYPERLCRIAEQFNAEKCEYGDSAIKLHISPRVSVTMIIWAGDDEFPTRASILFDQTAAKHMPLDALLAAVNLAVSAVIKTSDKTSN